jgi:hypothetical protein
MISLIERMHLVKATDILNWEWTGLKLFKSLNLETYFVL